MCKPRHIRASAPATGPTTRLNDGESIENFQYTRSRTHAWHPARFPWWTLWLIWPLIGLAKAAAPAVLGALGWLSQIAVPLLPALLIAIGIALLLMRRRNS